MKKSVILLFLAGLIGMGATLAMGDTVAGQAKAAECDSYYKPDGDSREELASSSFHTEGNHGNSGALFPRHTSNLQFMYVKKALKGYSSMKRTPYFVQLMQLV